MQEVDKLNQLIAECCPEVFDNRFQPTAETTDLREETDLLHRHRLNILTEAVGSKKSQ